MNNGDPDTRKLSFASVISLSGLCRNWCGARSNRASDTSRLPRICTCGSSETPEHAVSKNKGSFSRRRFSLLGGLAFLSALGNPLQVFAKDEDTKKSAQSDGTDKEPVCKNCRGSGKVPCELCQGTGFWKALSSTNPRQEYKGVTCPECEGAGTIICPVCLGTGDGNIKGMLRRKKVKSGKGRMLQTN
eukprot:Plantae.Rhodophyta-Hildenbrandia_rubra.ctg17483.p1 GENE.Plantae.Rhodophyta-Hildenbrandia_rubra.ctg17483~~Plantae.Rhodophyta-Hildenbrandia_rubra.ctg17483.p1  ORF type:complete len:188 (-),score=17.43 Plantae.Rhodophyta-Hildenbrandia_rubra.ctg17483:423-986(-)